MFCRRSHASSLVLVDAAPFEMYLSTEESTCSWLLPEPRERERERARERERLPLHGGPIIVFSKASPGELVVDDLVAIGARR